LAQKGTEGGARAGSRTGSHQQDLVSQARQSFILLPGVVGVAQEERLDGLVG
jgi:hypothetical protein